MPLPSVRPRRHGLLREQTATWELVRDYLQDQIAIGRYPTGSWLPSVRALAKELSINRNTVSKVYQALGRDGVLEAVRGRGVRVVGSGPRTASTEARMLAELEGAIRGAYANRIDRDWLLARFAAIARDTYAALSVRVAFVECSDVESRGLAKDLSEHLSLEIEPVVLSDLTTRADELADYEVLATTFFHLQEVTAVMGGKRVEVVGMNHSPSHETVLQIARLEPGITIAVVTQNERTLELLKSIVDLYARGHIIGTTTAGGTESLRSALRDADVIIDQSAVHDLVLRAKPRASTITVKFHIEKQSIEYLRETVARRREAVPAAI
jgi:GntR family transcriptional regulator